LSNNQFSRRPSSVYSRSIQAVNLDLDDPRFQSRRTDALDPTSSREGVKTLVSGRGPGAHDDSHDVAVVPELFDGEELPMVGRHALRTDLWKLLENVLKHRSVRVAVLTGPRGIGKSRVARWLCEQGEEEGLVA